MANKKTLKSFREVSRKLPIVEQPTRMKVIGSEIIKHNPNAKDTEGNALDSEKVYSCDATMKKNHYRAMKKIFKKGGIESVNKYIQDVIAFENGRRSLINESLGGLTERRQSITHGF